MIDLNKTFVANPKYLYSSIIDESQLLKNSSLVDFLQKYKDYDELTLDEFKKSEYYRCLLGDFYRKGKVYGVTNKSKLHLQANYFLELYRAVRDGTFQKNRHKMIYTHHTGYCEPVVAKMPNIPDYFMIKEGHHRLSCHYVLGLVPLKIKFISDKEM